MKIEVIVKEEKKKKVKKGGGEGGEGEDGEGGIWEECEGGGSCQIHCRQMEHTSHKIGPHIDF